MKTNKMLATSTFCQNVIKSYVAIELLIILYQILDFQNGNCTRFTDFFFLTHLWHVTFISLSWEIIV